MEVFIFAPGFDQVNAIGKPACLATTKINIALGVPSILFVSLHTSDSAKDHRGDFSFNL